MEKELKYFMEMISSYSEYGAEEKTSSVRPRN
jgi:hypothetical protein